MGQIPTKRVIRKADSKEIIINAVDFDKNKHKEPAKLKPVRKTRTYKKTRSKDE